MRLSLLSLLLTALLAIPAWGQPMIFVANGDFAPYSTSLPDQPPGIDVDVFMEAAKRAGVEVKVVFRSLDQLLVMVEKGEADGALALFRTPEREQAMQFMLPAPIHYSDYVLFTKLSDKFSFRSYDDLKGKVVGRVSGVDLGEEFEAAAGNGVMTVVDYHDKTAALSGILTGEIDGFAGNIDVTYYRLKAMGMTSSIVYLPKKILSEKPAYVVLSKASTYPDKEVAFQQIERALAGMHKDGSYRKIAHRYLLRF